MGCLYSGSKIYSTLGMATKSGIEQDSVQRYVSGIKV